MPNNPDSLSSPQRSLVFAIGLLTLAASGCQRQYATGRSTAAIPPSSVTRPLPPTSLPQLKQFIDGAVEQSKVTTGYDPSYVKLAYPNGDVPRERGVCADVIVRAFRSAGVDLQKEVHEDMQAARSSYSTKWGSNAPDKNIDHRRVLNLMKYFERQGKSLPISDAADDYQPGDIVAWELSSGIDHIGIVTNMMSDSDGRLLIVHNIGAGTRIEDVLLDWTIKGHYRYF